MTQPIEFYLTYLKYISQVNSSWAILSLIKEVEEEINSIPGFYSQNIYELCSIAHCEYQEAKEKNDDVLSMEEVLNRVVSNKRDKKIKNILE